MKFKTNKLSLNLVLASSLLAASIPAFAVTGDTDQPIHIESDQQSLDMQGNVVFTTSAGSVGFKGTKKSTPYAASKVAEALADVAKARGVERIAIILRGIGPGRESALRSLGTKGFEIQSIKDRTPVPHNGPRLRKVRRV